MKRKIPVFLFPVIALILVAGFIVLLSKGSSGVSETKSLTISTSFYPLYFFTKEITRDLADVVNITPSGVEPHDYEPSTTDIATLEKSNLIILNGVGLEPWGDRVKDMPVVFAGESLAKDSDPHVWLDPVLAKEEVSEITKALNTISPGNMHIFGENADLLQRKLIELDQEFTNGLKNCKQKNIVTSHAAFGYLAARYGFTQVAIAGLSPDEEPSPKKLSEIAKFVHDHNIRYIFTEKLVSPKLAETIAKEVGVTTLVLDPLEGISEEDQKAGHDYFSIQLENLRNLKDGLECVTIQP